VVAVVRVASVVEVGTGSDAVVLGAVVLTKDVVDVGWVCVRVVCVLVLVWLIDVEVTDDDVVLGGSVPWWVIENA